MIKMKIGAFHNVVFEVSSHKVLTFDNYKRETSHNYAEHKILNAKPKLESVGKKLLEVSLEILLHGNLGVDVNSELSKLRELVENAEVDYLIIGEEVIGKFVIEDMSEDVETWNGGKPLVVKASVKFKEYV